VRRRLVGRMGDDAQTPAGFQELDSAFHLALIRGAGNELGTLVTQALGTTMRKTMMDAIRDSDDWPSQRERLVDGLREIADAIADGDRDRAAELTTRHIATFWEDQLRRPRGGAR
jgi:GntR family transcriptional repressor for pyruvate dehydrogenase complex